MSYLSIHQLSKSFKDKDILKHIHLDIHKGQFVVLLGPSGCGKSTLLRCIAGLETFNEGNIYLDDLKITNITPAKRNIGMIFQQYSLFPTKTVYDNIAFGLKVRKAAKPVIAEKVRQLLTLVGLSDAENRYPSQLSGGEQQRVALARSLIIEPKVVLFDEPLSAIDAKLRRELQRAIKNIHQTLGMTSIFVTHDQEEAMLLADEIYVMNRGKIEQKGSPKELYYQPKSLFVAQFIGDKNIFSRAECKKLFGISISHEWMVISPEHILLHEHNETIHSSFHQSATIDNIFFLGDYERLILNVDGFTIKVNISTKQMTHFEKNQSIYFSIPDEYCLFVEDSDES